jgi:hypothetical protein
MGEQPSTELDPAITQKSTENIFMKFDIWIDGSIKLCASFSFLPMWKFLVAVATNRVKIWQICT